MQLVTKWKEVIMSDESNVEQSSSDMNVASWLSHAMLDGLVSCLLCSTTLVTSEPTLS